MVDPLATIKADGPDYLNLRKAGRIMIVAPALLAFGMFVVGNDTFATYTVFAAFVGLVFADYGGPRRKRAMAYVTMMVAGGAAVILGGLLSSYPVAGVMGMFVVTFVATFATMFGGYMALHVAPVALAYSLSVLMSPEDLLIPERVAGWVLGGFAAMVAALVLWPIERRTGLLEATAKLAAGLGNVVASLADPAVARDRLDGVRSEITALQARLSTPLRPSGPAVHDIALMQVIQHLEHGTELAAAAIDQGLVAAEDAELQQEVESGLARASAVLSGDDDAAGLNSSLEQLDEARRSTMDRVDETAAGDARQGIPALAVIRRPLPLLALSHVTMWIQADSALAKDLDTGSDARLDTAPELSQQVKDSVRSHAERGIRSIRRELDPGGVILRNSVRAGVALAVAILLADILPVEHGFWIALGALSVLRSGASSTHATAVQAVAGTVAGFVLAAIMVLLIGKDGVLLWALFPIVVGIAAFSPGAIHYAVGQAAFTVMVVMLFSLLEDPGFRTDVVRVETVTIGAVSAAVLSLVLWPRGARAALGHAVARVYEAAATASRTFVTGSSEARESAEQDLADAWRGAEAAFSAALAEHDEPIDTGQWVSILQPPTLIRSLVSGLVPKVEGAAAGCRPAVATAEQHAASIADQLAAVRDELEPASTGQMPGDLTFTAPSDRDADLERCIVASAADDEQMLEALSLVGWSAWLDQVAASLERAQPAVQRVAAASAPRAWLHRPDRDAAANGT